MEETTAETGHVENEVILLRKRVYGCINSRNKSQSNLPTLEDVDNCQDQHSNLQYTSKNKLFEELEVATTLRQDLLSQGDKLSSFMNTLRKSTNDLSGELFLVTWHFL